MNKSTTKVTPTEILTTRSEIPADYHCQCEYCRTNFLGEIWDITTNRPYSAKARKSYHPQDVISNAHLCPGHFQGYRWAIHQFTQPGDLVLDPTVGTGTAIVEAINNDRFGIGIELEYPNITQVCIDAQYSRLSPATGKYLFRQGDARFIKDYLTEWGIQKETIQLIINGTPYPKLNLLSSDAPERKSWTDEPDENHPKKIGKRNYQYKNEFDYEDKSNFGLLKGEEYWNLIENMYWDSIEWLKPGGYFVVLIKDMTRNKEPYLLHKMVIDHVLEKDTGLEYFGSYIHPHFPPTLHMSTYPKKFPGTKIPLYQTGIVLKKKTSDKK